MDKLEAYLKAAETAAGGVYARLAGTYQKVDTFTAEHPEVKEGVLVAETLLKATGIDIVPEVNMTQLVWGKLGTLLAADATVQGPVIVKEAAS